MSNLFSSAKALFTPPAESLDDLERILNDEGLDDEEEFYKGGRSASSLPLSSRGPGLEGPASGREASMAGQAPDAGPEPPAGVPGAGASWASGLAQGIQGSLTLLEEYTGDFVRRAQAGISATTAAAREHMTDPSVAMTGAVVTGAAIGGLVAGPLGVAAGMKSGAALVAAGGATGEAGCWVMHSFAHGPARIRQTDPASTHPTTLQVPSWKRPGESTASLRQQNRQRVQASRTSSNHPQGTGHDRDLASHSMRTCIILLKLSVCARLLLAPAGDGRASVVFPSWVAFRRRLASPFCSQ